MVDPGGRFLNFVRVASPWKGPGFAASHHGGRVNAFAAIPGIQLFLTLYDRRLSTFSRLTETSSISFA
jgi:hypothetical protein